MATPAWRLEVEKTVEQRLERLEVHVEHIQSDVTELKGKLSEMDHRLSGQIKEVDLRLTGKIDALDQKLTAQIREVDQRLTGKIDALEKKLTDQMDVLEKKLGDKIDTLIQGASDLKVGRFVDRVWYMLMSAGLLWVMAKAFKWI
ncbi:MAG TPA: hypothetical protein VN750_13270 [Steroidobacteraceae bacterium]|nr:hypothetical protein [Steroidobacteraceae bacterium]